MMLRKMKKYIAMLLCTALVFNTVDGHIVVKASEAVAESTDEMEEKEQLDEAADEDGDQDGDADEDKDQSGDAGENEGQDGDAGENEGQDGDAGENEGQSGDAGENEGQSGDAGENEGQDATEEEITTEEVATEEETTTEEVATEEETTTEEATTEEETTEEAITEEEIAEEYELGDYTVSFCADAGVFPADAKVVFREINNRRVENALEKEVGADADNVELVTYLAVDITVYDKDNNEIQPDTDKGSVRVSFTCPKQDNSKIANQESEINYQVFHVESNASKIEEIDIVEEKENKRTAEDEIIFEAEHFSIYALTGTVTSNSPSTNNTQLVIDGEIKWNDSGIEDLRPDKSALIFIVCDANGNEVAEITGDKLTAIEKEKGNWTYELTVTNIPQDILKDADKYSVKINVKQYTVSKAKADTGKPTTSSDANIFSATAETVTISLDTTGRGNKEFTIKWVDGNNVEGKRPDIATLKSKIKLSAKIGDQEIPLIDDAKAKEYIINRTPIIKSNGNEIKVTFENLPQKINEKDVTWSVSMEDLGNKYIAKAAGTDTYNCYLCKDITAKLTWGNHAATDEQKPDKETLKDKFSLYEEGKTNKIEPEKTIVNEDCSLVTFENVPAYGEDGKGIVYYSEIDTTGLGYHAVYDNGTVSTASDCCFNDCNIHLVLDGKIDYTGTATWVDGESITRPDTTYTLWRYSKDKLIKGTGEKYSASTASVVFVKDGDNKKPLQKVFERETVENKTYIIEFKDLPQYDEDGYEYVYFVRQEINQNTKAEAYYKPYYDAAGKDDLCIYDKGTVKNVYQTFMDVRLRKTWTKILNVSDYENAKVTLELQRSVDGTNWESVKEVTLSGFSQQVNSVTSDLFSVPKANEDGTTYSYKVVEKKVNSIDITEENYTLNDRIFKWSQKIEGKEDEPTIYEVVNENPVKNEISFSKEWIGGYASANEGNPNEASTETPINLTVKQTVAGETKDYATITVKPKKPTDLLNTATEYTDNNGATIEYKSDVTTQTNPTSLSVKCSYSGNHWTWSIEGTTPWEVDAFDKNGIRAEYSVSEERISEVLTSYSYNISTTKTDDINIIKTKATINNNKITGTGNGWNYLTFEKKWVDYGAISERTPVEMHLLVVDKDNLNKVLYDLTDSTSRNNFKNAVISNSTYSFSADATNDNLIKQITSDSASAFKSIVLSAGNNWSKNLLAVPQYMNEYVSAVDGKLVLAEFSMQDLKDESTKTKVLNSSEVAITDGSKFTSYSDKMLINNGSYAYEVSSSNNGDTYTVTNKKIGTMDLNIKLDWKDTKPGETRPAVAKVTIYQYKASEGKKDIDPKITVKESDGEYSYDSTSRATEVSISLAAGEEKKTSFEQKVSGLPKYDTTTGEAYCYYVKVEYYDSSDSTQNRINDYAISEDYEYKADDVKTDTVQNKQDTVDKGTMTFSYHHVIEEAETSAKFYSLWRDDALLKENRRPDISFELYYDIVNTEGNLVQTEGDDPKPLAEKAKYIGSNPDLKSLSNYAISAEFKELPKYYFVYVDEKEDKEDPRNIKAVYEYRYYTRAAINGNQDLYEMSVYNPDKSPIEYKEGDINKFESYNKITAWSKYSTNSLKEGYKDQSKASDSESERVLPKGSATTSPYYIDDGGAVMLRIDGKIKIKGTKIWNLTANQALKESDTNAFPYVEVYLWRYIGSTAPSTADKNANDLRKAALYYTTLATDKKEFAFDLCYNYGTSIAKVENPVIEKYDDLGRTYTYSVSEAIYIQSEIDMGPEKDSSNWKMLPTFIMEAKSTAAVNAINLTNTLTNSTSNQRTLEITKEWTGLNAQNGYTVNAKFEIYQIESNIELTAESITNDILTNAKLYGTYIVSGSKTKEENKESISSSKEITKVPIYSPRGLAYYYVVKEIKSFSPSYEQKDVTSLDSSQCSKCDKTGCTDGIYILYSNEGVTSFNKGTPEAGNNSTKTAPFKNEYKKSSLAVLEGTVKWDDYNDGFNTRVPFNGKSPIELTITRTAASQSGGTANTYNTETVVKIKVPDNSENSTEITGTLNGVEVKFKVTWTKGDTNAQWTYKITDTSGNAIFDVNCENGNPWKYKVVESIVSNDECGFKKNYKISNPSSLSQAVESSGTYTVTMDEVKNTLYHLLKIQKQWSDNIDQYTVRPTAVKGYLQIRKNGDTLDNSWKVLNPKASSIKFDSLSTTAPTTEADGLITISKTSAWCYNNDNFKIPYGYVDSNIKQYEYRFIETALIFATDSTDTTISSSVVYDVDQSNIPTAKTGTTERDSVSYYKGSAGSYIAEVPVSFTIGGTDGTGVKTGIMVYNTLDTDTNKSVKIVKKWAGETFGTQNVQKDYNTRPEALYFMIQRKVETGDWSAVSKSDGNPLVLKLTTDDQKTDDLNCWEKEYTDLPGKDASGKECTYRAIEVSDEKGTALASVGTGDDTKSYIGSYLASPQADSSEYNKVCTSTITNTYVPTTALTVKKEWDDDNNRDGLRPDTVTFALMYYDYNSKETEGSKKWVPVIDSESNEVTVTLGKQTADDGTVSYSWSHTFNNLPKYYRDVVIESDKAVCKPMEYAVKETPITTSEDTETVKAYTTKYYGGNDSAVAKESAKEKYYDVKVNTGASGEATITILNIHTPATKTVQIGKEWYGDQDTKNTSRPASIQVQFWRTYKPTEDQIVYEYCYKDGSSYKWEEVTSKPADTDSKYLITIGNGDNPSTKTDGDITFDRWYLEIGNLPVYTNPGISDSPYNKGEKREYSYYVKEFTNASGYNSMTGNVTNESGEYEQGIQMEKLTAEGNDPILICVKNQVNKTKVAVKIIWNDENNRFGKRENTNNAIKVTIQRLEVGVDQEWHFVDASGTKDPDTRWEKSITEVAGEYKTSFDNIPLYSSAGNKYAYRVVLLDNSGNVIASDSNGLSEQEKNGLTLTNKNDGYQYAYDASANTIATDIASGYAYKTQMTLNYPVVKIEGTVEWQDASDFYGKRPENVNDKGFAFNLYEQPTKDAAGTRGEIVGVDSSKPGYKGVSLSMVGSGNEWTYSYGASVPKYDDNHNIINYYVAETVPTEYKAGAQGSSDLKAQTESVQVPHASLSADGGTYVMTTIVNYLHGGSLKVNKKVQNGDTGKQFEFHVYLSEREDGFSEDSMFKEQYKLIAKNGTVTNVNASDGKILLRDGETCCIPQIYIGTYYKVTEVETVGYTTSATNEEGKIEENVTVTAEYVNTGDAKEESSSSHKGSSSSLAVQTVETTTPTEVTPTEMTPEEIAETLVSELNSLDNPTELTEEVVNLIIQTADPALLPWDSPNMSEEIIAAWKKSHEHDAEALQLMQMYEDWWRKNRQGRLDSNVPETGDQNRPYLWLLAAIVSGVGYMLLGKKKKNSQANKEK